MILCVCLNPAVDVTYHVRFTGVGASHVVPRVSSRAGGKATNVARLLHQLGVPVRLLVPVGGPATKLFETELAATGLPLTAVPISGVTRSTLSLADGTIFNELGPELTSSEWHAVRNAFSLALAGCAVVVFAGSIPPGATRYAPLIELARAAGVRTVVDTSGAALLDALAAGPDVVAPNLAEARAALGDQTLDPQSAGVGLRARGAMAAVVSAAARGLVASTPDGSWRAEPPHRVAGNPTGAGDAVTAAIATGMLASAPWPEVIGEAVALAAAAVATDSAGEFASPVRDEVRRLVSVERLV